LTEVSMTRWDWKMPRRNAGEMDANEGSCL
jgi:hypothetical protein